MLLLAAGVFAYLTLADGGGLLGGRTSLPERPTGTPLAEWREAPLVVYVYEEEAGQLAIETRAEFEAGVGTVSVWLEAGAARAEFVNYETLYLGERSAAWVGELRAALAEVRTVWARYRGKLTQPARDYRCERQEAGEARAGEATWSCELR